MSEPVTEDDQVECPVCGCHFTPDPDVTPRETTCGQYACWSYEADDNEPPPNPT